MYSLILENARVERYINIDYFEYVLQKKFRAL